MAAHSAPCTLSARRGRRLPAALALLVAGLSASTALAQSPPAGQAQRPTEITVLIAYASRTGATDAMAQAVEQGAASVPGTRVSRKRVDAVTADDLLAAHAIVVGTPVHNAGIAAEVKAFIERWPFEQLQNKVGAAFVAAGGMSAGEELATISLLASMLVYRFVVVGGETWDAALGASTVTIEGHTKATRGKADDAGLAKARNLGERVARVAKALKAGGWPDKKAPGL